MARLKRVQCAQSHSDDCGREEKPYAETAGIDQLGKSTARRGLRIRSESRRLSFARNRRTRSARGGGRQRRSE